MERLKAAKELVVELHEQYVAELDIKNVTLDIDSIESIEKAFESVYRRDALATRTKTRFPRALTQKLRTAFADLLLLIDGTDIKDIKPPKPAKADDAKEAAKPEAKAS